MTTASQYATSRRSRAACVLEFLALVGIVAIAVLAVAVWGIVKLIDATSLRTVVWWGLVVVLVAGGAFIVFWLGVAMTCCWWHVIWRAWRRWPGVWPSSMGSRSRCSRPRKSASSRPSRTACRSWKEMD
mgnify:CR=1 FL=1